MLREFDVLIFSFFLIDIDVVVCSVQSAVLRCAEEVGRGEWVRVCLRHQL